MQHAGYLEAWPSTRLGDAIDTMHLQGNNVVEILILASHGSRIEDELLPRGWTGRAS